MDEERATSTSTSTRRPPSRGLVVAAVALLIVVAIAGIVLGKNRSAALVAAPVAAVPAPVTAPAVAAPAPILVEPLTVVYVPGQVDVPASASEGLVRFSDAARGVAGLIEVMAAADSPLDEPIARMRLANVRHALEANGLQGSRIKSDFTVKPKASLKPGDVDRVMLSVH